MNCAKALLALFFIFFTSCLVGINYYSGGSLNVNDVNSWWTNRNNTGSHPANFTAANQFFYVESGDQMTASAKWTVEGTSSKVIIENGGKITTGAFNHDFILDMNSGGTYWVDDNTYSNLIFGSLHNNSTFVLDHASIIFQDDESYGNLTVNKGVADCFGDSGNLEVYGTLQINASGSFEGAYTVSHNHTFGNVYLNGGIFYGTTSSGYCTYDISGSITIDSGTFYGTEGSANAVYTIGGDVIINGGTFYGNYRGSGTLATSTFYIGGSFVRNGGTYNAVNRIDGGYPSYYLSGAGKMLSIGTYYNSNQTQHYFQIEGTGSYTLGAGLSFNTGREMRVYGTLNSSAYQLYAYGTGVTFNIWGTFRTAVASGFSGSTTTAIHNNNSPNIYLQTDSVVEYNSASSQTVTSRADYANLLISNSGTKTLGGAVTVAKTLSLSGPLSIGATTLTLNGAVSGSGTLTGGASSDIVFGGTGASTGLPSVTVRDLTVSRANGITLSGDVTIGGTLSLTGNLTLNNHTLYMNGRRIGSGIIVGGSSSSMVIGESLFSFTLNAITLGSLTLNRANGTTMGGDATITNLILTNGSLSISTYRLTTDGLTTKTSGSLTGSSGSNMTISGSAANYVFPNAILLNNLTLSRANGASLAGSSMLNTLSLQSGNLSIGPYQLTMNDNINTTGGGLTGGASSNLYMDGGSGPLKGYIPTVTLNNLTIMRTAGIGLSGAVTIGGTLACTQGGCAIESGTLNLNGAKTGSSLITGTSNSTLNIGGSGATFTLETITAGTISLLRANGCDMSGAVVVNNLSINSGTFSVGSNSLTINQNLTETFGSLFTTSSSTLIIGGAGSAFSLRSMTLGTLTLNRAAGCTLTGDVTTTVLNLQRGTLQIAAYELTINGSLSQTAGILMGGVQSRLMIGNSMMTVFTIPAITLQRLTLNRVAGANLSELTTVQDVVLASGNLNLNGKTLNITGNLSYAGGNLVGNSTSTLSISGSGAGLRLQTLTIGTFILDRAEGATLLNYMYIYTQVSLLQDELYNSFYLVMMGTPTITRAGGSLDSEPDWDLGVNVTYQVSCTTGFEIPTDPTILQELTLMPHCNLIFGSDVTVNAHVRLTMQNIMQPGTLVLYLAPSATIEEGVDSYIFGNVVQDIGSAGFSSPAVGIGIASGTTITGFSANQQDEHVEVGGSQGINRIWSLEGSFSGSVSLTLTWPTSADNGHAFSPTNRAAVYCFSGGRWQRVGSFFDVSGMEPRSITVNTTHFSDWTVGAEDETLPVELSSFTAVLTQQNFVKLSWVTQSECGLSGYRIYRNTILDFATAEDMQVLIPATNTTQTASYNYTDREIVPPILLFYWLESVEIDGSTTMYGPVSIFVEGDDDPGTPTPPLETRLERVYPNPFNPNTTIQFTMKEADSVKLSIFNNKGQLIRQINQTYNQPGVYRYVWDGMNESLIACGSGVYFIRMQAGKYTGWTKAVLMK